MTQQDKKLLIKDLCARLPYRVVVDYAHNAFDVHKGHYLKSGSKNILNCYLLDTFISPRQNENGEYIKPYLIPLSKMTEEQKISCFEGTDIELDENSEIWSKISSDTYTTITNMNNWLKVIDWLNKNHFDYRGLIEKGLAIDSTDLNIYRLWQK